MNSPMKKPAIVLITILASFLFVFAAASNGSHTRYFAASSSVSPNDSVNTTGSSTDNTESSAALYSELNLEKAGLNQDIFTSALKGMQKLEAITKKDIITIIDFSQPSNQKRLYVVDLKNKEILFNTFVAHGRNTGTLWAKSFSNENSSLKSSPGFYATAETYMGDNGYSLRLDGLEKNINDHARARAVVMHGAPYASESAVQSLGFLGRSWGCPAVPMSLHTEIINTIKDGSCLFIYSPEKSYQERSTILNS